MVSAEQLIDAIEPAYGGPHKGFRTLHAKGRFYTGSFTATPEATALSRAGHLQGAAVPALVRLSDGSGHPNARDAMPDVRGLAVSFELPDGKRTDIVAATAPRFPVRTAEAFIEFTRAAGYGPKRPWLLPVFLARHPSAVPVIAANIRAGAIKPPRSFAETTFYAIHAFKWTNAAGESRWVRYVWAPRDPAAASRPRGKDPDYLFRDLEDRLADGGVRFTLRVQLGGEGDDPHDPMAVWASREWIDAGTLSVTAREESRETADASGAVFVFDPTKLTDGVEASDDPILALRRQAYSESARRRSR